MGCLISDKQGALYGTAWINSCTMLSCFYGIVFKLTPPANAQTGWTETVLHTVTGGSDGTFPGWGLIADREGAFYGTTQQGGYPGAGTAGNGTAFKLAPPANGQSSWTLTMLHSFNGGTDGRSVGGLIADTDGALYGTTYQGGITSSFCPYGCGTVFKLTPPRKGEAAWTENVLYRFKGGGSDGAQPAAGLIADKHGVLYGITISGGNANAICEGGACGTIFKLDLCPGPRRSDDHDRCPVFLSEE